MAREVPVGLGAPAGAGPLASTASRDLLGEGRPRQLLAGFDLRPDVVARGAVRLGAEQGRRTRADGGGDGRGDGLPPAAALGRPSRRRERG